MGWHNVLNNNHIQNPILSKEKEDHRMPFIYWLNNVPAYESSPCGPRCFFLLRPQVFFTLDGTTLDAGAKP